MVEWLCIQLILVWLWVRMEKQPLMDFEWQLSQLNVNSRFSLHRCLLRHFLVRIKGERKSFGACHWKAL